MGADDNGKDSNEHSEVAQNDMLSSGHLISDSAINESTALSIFSR